jgi:hypothetical protein
MHYVDVLVATETAKVAPHLYEAVRISEEGAHVARAPKSEKLDRANADSTMVCCTRQRRVCRASEHHAKALAPELLERQQRNTFRSSEALGLRRVEPAGVLEAEDRRAQRERGARNRPNAG